jgi:uncharacterized protein
MKSKRIILYSILEIIILYIFLPLLFLFYDFHFPVMLILFPLGIGIYFFLRHDKTFDKNLFSNWQDGKKQLKPVLILFIISALVMLVIILIINPSHLFYLIREKPLFLLVISIFYPVFSVIPQALAYRALFFHRYAHLFPGKWFQIIVSALLFSFGHILYKNYLVLILTFVAGIIYSYHYIKSKSLIFSILEHSAYGIWLFASGLGMFFISSKV